jgi:hypothetical protein
MYVSLLRNLRKTTKLEVPDSLYSQFTHVPSPPGKFGLCSLESCASEFVSAGGSNEDWCLCPEHYLLASRATRRKHLRALFWQSAIMNCFSDLRIRDEISASGRYSKLCALLERATERVAINWRAVLLEAHSRVDQKRERRRVKLRTH